MSETREMDFVKTGLGDGICAGTSEVKAMLIAGSRQWPFQ